MSIIMNFLIVLPILLMYYIFKIYYNRKMKLILIIANCFTILCLIVAIFISNQELFDYLFPLESLNILIWIYYLYDKSNYKLYTILAETNTIPIVLGGNWFWKGKKEIDHVIEFFNSNIRVMNKNKDINIILLDRNEKATDLSFIFSKRADMDFYKDNIINNSSYKVSSKGRFLRVSFERNCSLTIKLKKYT